VNNPQSNSKEQFVTVGTIGQTYGVYGWLKIHSYTEPYTNIITYRPWYIYDGHFWQAITATDCKCHGKHIIAHFLGYDTPEQAKLLVNFQIGIKHTQLPKLSENEYYWADLINLQVYNHHQQLLGTVDRLFATGANDVLVVKNAKREYLIPYVLTHIITKIDLINKLMVVQWEEDY
jgi:16S rRNA processing protein RimM